MTHNDAEDSITGRTRSGTRTYIRQSDKLIHPHKNHLISFIYSRLNYIDDIGIDYVDVSLCCSPGNRHDC